MAPEASSGKTPGRKCPFCRRIGLGLSVYLSRDQVVPEEFDRFIVRLESIARYTLLECPSCRTCFKRYTVIDNEIGTGYVSVEIEEITAERVEQLRILEKNWRRQFSRQVRARLRRFSATFTPRERALIAVFIDLHQESLSIYELVQARPHEDRSGLQRTLDGLAEKGALVRSEQQGIRHYRIRQAEPPRRRGKPL
ncbi:MAG TPA: hypothetical protein PKK12_00485 [Candidatus Aminicenantes bacterium]|nr:hypothetical protein [Candidatus Aminicenantes bacterium]